MLLGSVDAVQLQQWSEQHCFGAALWFQITALTPVLSLLPHLHLEAPGASLEMGVSDLDIPGTMSLNR
jgi:hypothetical protein